MPREISRTQRGNGESSRRLIGLVRRDLPDPDDSHVARDLLSQWAFVNAIFRRPPMAPTVKRILVPTEFS